MATVYGVNRTLKRTGAVNTIEPEMNGARVCVAYDSYTCAATANGEVIQLMGLEIPAEARIVGWAIDHAAMGTTIGQMKFGTGVSDACLMAYTAAVDTANILNMYEHGVSQSLGYEITAGTGAGSGQTLILTLSGAGASTWTGAIKVAVYYTRKG